MVALRSRLLRTLSGTGAMAAIAEPAERISARLEAGVELAAVNGPLSSVVSGDPEAVERLVTACAADGIGVHRLAVDYASHSAAVERIRTDLVEALGDLHPVEGAIPFCSSVTPGLLAGPGLDASYWYQNLRQTVRFGEAATVLMDSGHRVFVEISAHPVLVGAIEEAADAAGRPVTTLARFAVITADRPISPGPRLPPSSPG